MRGSFGIERLENRIAPAGVLAVGSHGPVDEVKLFHDSNNDGTPDPTPYATLAGGCRAAIGHFTSTSTLQVAVADNKGLPIVKIYQLDANDMPTGTPESFTVFPNSKNLGLFLTRFNSTGTGLDSLLVSPGYGAAPVVKVYNDSSALNGATPNDGLLGNSQIDSFLAFKSSFRGGVHLAAGRNLAAAGGDILVVAPGAGSAPVCFDFKDSNGNLLLSDDFANAEKLMPFSKTFRGGVSVAVGDVGSPSTNPELIFGKGRGSTPTVEIYSDSNLNGKYADEAGPATTFLAYDSKYRGGVNVTYTRLSPANVGGSGEVVVSLAGAGKLPVNVFKTKSNTGFIMAGDAPLASLFAFGYPDYNVPQYVSFGGNGV
jgi:hypothetical protein